MSLKGKAATDISGRRFGELEVVRRAPNVTRAARWLCKCDCGELIYVEGRLLRNGRTAACSRCAKARKAASNG